MNKLTTKEEIFDLIGASTSSIALGAAVETGLLEMLAEKPMGGEEVSQVMNIPGKRGHYWLQMLTELGILEMDAQGYIPSALTHAAFLDADKLERWKHVAADNRERLAGLHNLALHLREPGSIWKVQGLVDPKNDYEKMIEDPERARVYTRLLYNFYMGSKNAFAESLDMKGVERMMDVGGGSGIVSILLAQKYPGLTSVVVDLENVCIEGRKIVEENHLSDRIAFHGANLLADEFPQGFDLVLHYDIGVFGEELFCKLKASLKPGGRIVVVFRFPPSENVAPEPYLGWAFLDSLKDPDFGFPTVAQIQVQLVRAGFQILPNVHTSPDGYVIQARKTAEQE